MQTIILDKWKESSDQRIGPFDEKKNFFLQIDLFHFKISQTIHLNTRHIDIWFEILPHTRDLKKQIELELEFKQKAI